MSGIWLVSMLLSLTTGFTQSLNMSESRAPASLRLLTGMLGSSRILRLAAATAPCSSPITAFHPMELHP